MIFYKKTDCCNVEVTMIKIYLNKQFYIGKLTAVVQVNLARFLFNWCFMGI